MRVVAGVLVGIGVVVAVLAPGGGIGILAILVVMGGVLLAGNERARIVTSREGIRSVPILGQSKRYAWSEINGFGVQRIPGGRYGGPVVSVSLTDRSDLLMPTLQRGGSRESVQRTCDALNAELERAARERGSPAA